MTTSSADGNVTTRCVLIHRVKGGANSVMRVNTAGFLFATIKRMTSCLGLIKYGTHFSDLI